MLRNELKVARVILISSRTVRRLLSEAGLDSRGQQSEKTKLPECVLLEIIAIGCK